ncbi:hypothetical protein TELCIR_18687, partial [Teladorsagia circumcincta]
YEKLLDEQKIIKRLLESPYSDYDWRVRPRGRLGYSDDEDYDNEPVLITELECRYKILRLADYPLDVQTCVVDFASYAYTTKDIGIVK